MSSYNLAEQGGGNLFLIPNATFFVELVIFLIVLGVIWRYVVPPVKRVMAERQEMIRRQIQESQQASKRLAEAQAHYSEALAQARVEAAAIREAARADAQQIKDEMRQQAEQEVARIRERGAEQLASQRAQVVRELQLELGTLAVTLAGRIVGESVADDARRAGTVDRFLDELQGMAVRESSPPNVIPNGAVSVPNGSRGR
ncbi:MAG: F0F1 ATP synthase subunit B [Pseudonocardiales bacterium]|nr:F0F1 ATP synthase subunit B [Pseudonocardiales bacterium]